jgi:hypothetical protein
MDFKYYVKKLDIDNLISYDYYRLGIITDTFFYKLSNESIDFTFIVKSYFIYFFFRDFFFKLFEYMKLFIFFQNKFVYSIF